MEGFEDILKNPLEISYDAQIIKRKLEALQILSEKIKNSANNATDYKQILMGNIRLAVFTYTEHVYSQFLFLQCLEFLSLLLKKQQRFHNLRAKQNLLNYIKAQGFSRYSVISSGTEWFEYQRTCFEHLENTEKLELLVHRRTKRFNFHFTFNVIIFGVSYESTIHSDDLESRKNRNKCTEKDLRSLLVKASKNPSGKLKDDIDTIQNGAYCNSKMLQFVLLLKMALILVVIAVYLRKKI